ncbi:MAG: hypothetical protein PUC11_04235 [Elusimicrobia bacterium]|nr:hypothetical protein [Elusimicrobiota bacterium]
MNVPQYKNRVTVSAPRAAGGTVATPNPEAFDRGARQIAALGQGLVNAGETWKKGEQQIYDRIHAAEERKAAREQTKRLADAQLAWQKENDELLNGKLDENGNTVSEGLLQKKLENASSVAKDYFEKGGELVNKYAALAKTPEEEEYIRTWLARQFQDNYDRTVRHQLAEERQSANEAAQAFFASSAGIAGAITRPQDMRAHLDDVYKISDDNGRGNGLNAEALKLARFELANQNMTAAIQGAVWNGNIPAARGLLTQLKNDMLPDDWNKLNWYVSRAEEAAKKDAARAAAAGSPVAKDALYERAVILYEQNPEDFQREIKSAKRNLYSYQQTLAEKGVAVDAKDLKTYLDWSQKLLDDPDGRLGAQKIQNWAHFENKYAGFDIDEKTLKIGNKELNNPGNLISAIGAIKGHIAQGDFTAEDEKKAQKTLTTMRRVLGNMEITPSTVGKNTVGGEVVRHIQTLTEGGEVLNRPDKPAVVYTPYGFTGRNSAPERIPLDPILLPEEKGLLMEETYERLTAMNINLETEKWDEKQKAVAVAQDVARTYLKNKFVIDYNDVMSIQYGGEIIPSYAVKPNPHLGAKLAANYENYRVEKSGGVERLVLRGKDGKILHEQLL